MATERAIKRIASDEIKEFSQSLEVEQVATSILFRRLLAYRYTEPSYYIFYFKHWVEINGNWSFQGSGLVTLRNKVGHEQEKKKWKIYFKFSRWLIYKHTIIRCVDRDVTVLLLLTNSSKRNISVLRGSIATHVDKNTKSTNNKLATMTSKWKSLIACERKNMFQIIRVHNLLSQFLYLYC